MIGRILLTLGVLAVTGFVLLVLIGLWDRYEQETAALTSQAGFSIDPNARAAAEAKRGRQGALGREQLTRTKFFQQGLKLVGTGAVGSTNQGMSVALSADGNTAIVGGPGPNNADRNRSPFVGPAGAAQRRCLEAARQQAGRHPQRIWRGIVVPRCVRRAVR
jgi:hypothetical protein